MLGGITVTEHVVRRAAEAVGPNSVLLAHPQSEDFSWAHDYPCHVLACGGIESDLLDRMWRSLMYWESTNKEADIIVRLTGDTPFVPIDAIRKVVRAVARGCDYAETRSDPSTLPNGIDAQAFSREVLLEADLTESSKEGREHVTPAVLKVAKRKHFVSVIDDMLLRDLPSFRMTVDHPTRAPSLCTIVDVHRRYPEVFDTGIPLT
jgi:spore coat polysaccharide biosynthesis protein SpsF (cytidylyltransferase family)